MTVTDKISEIKQAITAFWENYPLPYTESVSQRILQAMVEKLPDVIEIYGSGVLAYTICLTAANCNFWLILEDEPFIAMHELEQRLGDEGIRYGEVQQAIYRELKTYPWNSQWLPEELATVAEQELKDRFADLLLQAGVDIPEDIFVMLIDDLYGSIENARIHTLERYQRGLGLKQPVMEQILSEEEKLANIIPVYAESEVDSENLRRHWQEAQELAEFQPKIPDFSELQQDLPAEYFAFFPEDYEPNPEFSEMLPNLVGQAKNRQLARVNSPRMYRMIMRKNPFFLEGRYPGTLIGALNALPLSVLQAILIRHGPELSAEDMQRTEILAVLQEQLPQLLARDLHFMDQERYEILQNLGHLNGELRNPVEVSEVSYLVRSGYIFGYHRHGGVRFYLPPELAGVLQRQLPEERARDFTFHARCWVLLRLMANVYGVYNVNRFIDEAKRLFSSLFDGKDDAEIRATLLEVVLMLGRGADFIYDGEFIRHRELSAAGARKILAASELRGHAFHPIDGHVIDTYTNSLHDEENKLYKVLAEFIENNLSEITAHLLDDVLYLVEVAVAAGIPVHIIYREVESYGLVYKEGRSGEDLLRLLADYAAHTPVWNLRGYTPNEAGEAGSGLPS